MQSTKSKRTLKKVSYKGQSQNIAKIIVIGDSAVGKTNLIIRFIEDYFKGTFVSTIGVDFKTKIVNIDDTPIKLQIWDTAGQQKFHHVTKQYYKQADVILLCFAINNIDSFKNITNRWLINIKKQSPQNAKIILIGTKCDLQQERCIKISDIKQLQQINNIKYIETSSKFNIGVQQAFNLAAKMHKDYLQEIKFDLKNSWKDNQNEKQTRKFRLYRKDSDNYYGQRCSC